MKLTVLERLVLLNILPKEGDLTTIRIVRELREVLSFSEAEHASLAFKPDGDGNMRWNAEADRDEDFIFQPRAYALIADTLEKLAKGEKMMEDYLSVYDKFCEEQTIREVG